MGTKCQGFPGRERAKVLERSGMCKGRQMACVSRKKIPVQLALGIKVFMGVWRMRVEVSPLFMLRSFILPS